jgi:hypothetical protein
MTNEISEPELVEKHAALRQACGEPAFRSSRAGGRSPWSRLALPGLASRLYAASYAQVSAVTFARRLGLSALGAKSGREEASIVVTTWRRVFSVM